jgi:hypothetical protein
MSDQATRHFSFSFLARGVLAGASLFVAAAASGCASPVDDQNADASPENPASVQEAYVPRDPALSGCTNWIEWSRASSTRVDIRYHSSCLRPQTVLTAQGYTTRDGTTLCPWSRTLWNVTTVATPWCALYDPPGTQYWGFASTGSINGDTDIPAYGTNSRF